MIRFVLSLTLLTLLTLAAACSHLPGYRHRVAPKVTVVSEEAAAGLGESKATITILRKELVPTEELIKALLYRAERSERRYLSDLLLQWVLRVEEHAVYCQARLLPQIGAERGALDNSVLRTAEMDRRRVLRQVARQQYLTQVASEQDAGTPAPPGLDPGRKPDLSFVSRTGWSLQLRETECKVGPPAPNDQITLAAEAY